MDYRKLATMIEHTQDALCEVEEQLVVGADALDYLEQGQLQDASDKLMEALDALRFIQDAAEKIVTH